MFRPYTNSNNPTPYIRHTVVGYYCDYCKNKLWCKPPNKLSQKILNYHKDTLVHMIVLDKPPTTKDLKAKHFCENTSCKEEFIELYGE